MARKAKRSSKFLMLIAIWMLLMHFVDLYWLVMPSRYADGPHFGAIDFFSLLGIGGLFVAYFAAITKKKNLVAIHDPRLKESLTYENL